MKTIKLTNKELRALSSALYGSHKCCASGCVYPEMQRSRKDCDECEFTLSIHSIIAKIEDNG